mgnify:FL=1|jgi:hypothetical protein|tara:strand:- start:1763 stop:2023 length:261 start_codon:yes stop_codon:yes gene_type:complete
MKGSSPSIRADLDVISNMAKSLESISRLSRELQEEVLERVASGICPIELDGILYEVPEPIFALINSLVSQIQELSNLDEISGYKGN